MMWDARGLGPDGAGWTPSAAPETVNLEFGRTQ